MAFQKIRIIDIHKVAGNYQFPLSTSINEIREKLGYTPSVSIYLKKEKLPGDRLLSDILINNDQCLECRRHHFVRDFRNWAKNFVSGQKNKSQVQEIRQQFHLRHPSGAVSRNEFQETYGDQLTKKDCDLLFSIFDANKDGLIDEKEWIAANIILTVPDGVRSDKMHLLLFGFLDVDDNGEITRDELLRFYQAMYEFRRATGDFPQDTPEKLVEKILQHVDKDKNGKLDLNEFRLGWERNPGMFQAQLQLNVSVLPPNPVQKHSMKWRS